MTALQHSSLEVIFPKWAMILVTSATAFDFFGRLGGLDDWARKAIVMRLSRDKKFVNYVKRKIFNAN